MSDEPSVSCIYGTARPCFDMIERQEDHISLFLDSLEKQGFKDFEVLIADCIHDRRETRVSNYLDKKSNTYRDKTYPFDIIHFQAKSPWLDRGLWAGQCVWNQGILLARGELVLIFGDCSEPPPHYLEKIWHWYQKGYWCMGLVVYKKAGKILLKDELKEMIPKYEETLGTKTGILAFQRLVNMGWDANDVIRDSRWVFAEKSGWAFIRNVDGAKVLRGKTGAQQAHGYSAFPLSALLRVNGFDENLDGDKALGDQDMGMRLWMAGYDNVLLLDPEVYIYENSHLGVPKEVLWYDGPSIRSNYSLMILNELKDRWLGNSYRLTVEEIDYILKHGMSWGFPDKEATGNNEHFKWWLENPPIFDLAELRWEVQDKLEEGEVWIPDYYT